MSPIAAPAAEARQRASPGRARVPGHPRCGMCGNVAATSGASGCLARGGPPRSNLRRLGRRTAISHRSRSGPAEGHLFPADGPVSPFAGADEADQQAVHSQVSSSWACPPGTSPRRLSPTSWTSQRAMRLCRTRLRWNYADSTRSCTCRSSSPHLTLLPACSQVGPPDGSAQSAHYRGRDRGQRISRALAALRGDGRAQRR